MIEDFLRRNEGKTLEFKENTRNIAGIVKTVIAFANTAGGTILIGIRDESRELVGVENALQDEEKLANAISDSIAPLLVPDIEVCSFRDREFIVVRVPHIVAGPCYLKSKGPEVGVYVRLGSTNRLADDESRASLRLLAANRTFDELPISNGIIDESYLRLVFQRMSKSPTTKQCLSMGIYTDDAGADTPSIGGVLLFGRERTDLLPDSVIRCACFQGDTKELVIDSSDIYSPLPTAIDDIIRFIERNTKTYSVIGKTQRVDTPQFPPIAIREAVINSLLHSDYSMKGSHIQIALFDDRIEITNPGGLPYGQTMKKALSGYSRLRNRVIGRVFRELRLIEQWGSGIPRIVAICEKMGLRSPSFEEEGNHFRTTIYSHKQKKSILEQFEIVLVKHLSKHEAVQTQDAAKLWKISDRQTRTRLSQMVDRGILVRVSTSASDPRAMFILSEGYLLEAHPIPESTH